MPTLFFPRLLDHHNRLNIYIRYVLVCERIMIQIILRNKNTKKVCIPSENDFIFKEENMNVMKYFGETLFFMFDNHFR